MNLAATGRVPFHCPLRLYSHSLSLYPSADICAMSICAICLNERSVRARRECCSLSKWQRSSASEKKSPNAGAGNRSISRIFTFRARDLRQETLLSLPMKISVVVLRRHFCSSSVTRLTLRFLRTRKYVVRKVALHLTNIGAIFRGKAKRKGRWKRGRRTIFEVRVTLSRRRERSVRQEVHRAGRSTRETRERNCRRRRRARI